MRNTGIVLTVIGTGLLATSVYLFSQTGQGCAPLAARGDVKCALGFGALVASFGSLGTGIALWAVGQRHLNQDARSAQLFLTPVDGGAVAGLRLVSF
jgi:hypothetical protein